ncbi:MAG TPA: Gfo/Idh/MocA family oxidoreductase [Mycobacteriales bacterium]|nr:Gfo/Idh/MocA family oxidoreductase [Mycobacteriales bacterium]
MSTASASDQFGIGVIGAGMMGAHHVRTLDGGVSGAAPVAVSDADRERAAALGVPVLDDPYALIADPRVDAVLIASSDETHESFVLACLDAGKPVLCEKPLGLTAASAAKIVEYEAGRDLVSVGFMRRFDPSYVEMKRLLDEGAIGPALMAHCVHRNVDVPDHFSGDFSIVSSAVHEFDILRWLLGQEIVAVTVFTPTHSGFAAESLRDPRMLVVQLEGGAVADIEVFVNARYGYDVRCEIVGETGTVALRSPAAVTTRIDRRDATAVPADFRTRFAAAYRDELQAWVDGLRGGRHRLATASDGHRSNLICEAAIESGRTGRTVAVDLP